MKPIEHIALVCASLTRQCTPDFATVGKAYFGRGANEKALSILAQKLL
jgi:hypothetical protein